MTATSSPSRWTAFSDQKISSDAPSTFPVSSLRNIDRLKTPLIVTQEWRMNGHPQIVKNMTLESEDPESLFSQVRLIGLRTFSLGLEILLRKDLPMRLYNLLEATLEEPFLLRNSKRTLFANKENVLALFSLLTSDYEIPEPAYSQMLSLVRIGKWTLQSGEQLPPIRSS